MATTFAWNRPAQHPNQSDLLEDGEDGVELESDAYSSHDERETVWLQTGDAIHRKTSFIRRLSHRTLSACRRIAEWTRGPTPSRPWSIQPIFPEFQTAPIQFLDINLPHSGQRFTILLLLYAVWLLSFSLILRRSAFTDDVQGFGSTVRIPCGYTFWTAKNGCGLDGDACRPFSNYTLAFRCPGNCIKNWVLEPRAVGEEQVIYKPLVIGGPPRDTVDAVGSAIYRADSFVCGAAIHAGVISNAEGGCGVLELVGERNEYVASYQHGISSTGFNASFPSSFRFVPDNMHKSTCRDLRWPLLAVTVVCTTALSIFTTSPSVFFFSTFVIIFLHVSLVSDPPEGDYYSLLSSALGQLLPSAFIMYVVYLHVVRRTLSNLRAQFEKTFLWLGGCWLGALNNETFDQRIPIQRLTPHDIAQQPGAIPALLMIVFALLAIALGQAWALRIEGRMPLYLKVYSTITVTLLVLMMIPGMSLRIHHYILGLLLLPGTAMQNRPSLLYQGLLVGLFINGIARWGYASIISKTSDLLSDAQIGSALPEVLVPYIVARNITFAWAWPPAWAKEEKAPDEIGISVLVNDVERFRSHFHIGTDFNDVEGVDADAPSFTWTRHVNDLDRPEYFRFAYILHDVTQDYTKAGIWQVDNSWTPMRDGPSR